MQAKDHAALKARIGISLSEVQRELRHVERSLGSIDAQTHEDALGVLERELAAITPKMIAFFRSISRGHKSEKRPPEKQPRAVIAGQRRIYARYGAHR